MNEQDILAALAALDFDCERPCDWTTSVCGNTARWAGSLSCCKHVTYRCDTHRRSIDRVFAAGIAVPHIEGCGNDARRITWDVYGCTQ